MMDMVRTHCPGDDAWELHKDEMIKLYRDDNLPLREVMALMERKGFRAKKNQYEKYLKRKWKVSKNTSASKWKALAPIIREYDRQGRKFVVFIDGEKKSVATVHKETSRHGASANRESLDELRHNLPKGVVVQEAFPGIDLIDITDIPFLNLQNWITPRIYRLNVESAPKSVKGIFEALNIVPPSVDRLQSLSLAISPANLEKEIFRSPTYRGILFFLANNFAGLDFHKFKNWISSIPRADQTVLIDVIISMIRSYSHHPTLQAIARSLFQLSVEDGNLELMEFLLRQRLPAVHANIFVHDLSDLHDDFRPKCTVIERAAQLYNGKLIRILLEHDADVRLGKHGPLFYWCQKLFGSFRPLSLHRSGDLIFEILAVAGRRIDAHQMIDLIIRYNDEQHVFLLLSKILAKEAGYGDHEDQYLQEWNKQGIFDYIFLLCQDRKVKCMALEVMLVNKLELGSRIKDEFAKGQDIDIIEVLVQHGVKPSPGIAYCALQSGNEELVELITDYNAALRPNIPDDLDSTLSLNDSDEDLLSHQFSDPADLEVSDCSSTALEALSRVADRCPIEQPYWNRDEFKKGPRLGEALAVGLVMAIKQRQEDDALLLIDAGAGLQGYPRGSPSSPLEEALKARNLKLFRALLDAGANLSLDILGTAVACGDLDIVRELIKIGAAAKFNSGEDSRLLRTAIQNKDRNMADLLCENGLFIRGYDTQYDNWHNTRKVDILLDAVETGDVDWVRFVLELGVDPHNLNAIIESFNKGPAILDVLLEAHSARYPLHLRNWGGEILKYALIKDDLNLFKRALEAGADANYYACESRISKNFGWDSKEITVFQDVIWCSKETGMKFIELLLRTDEKRYNPETFVPIRSHDNRFTWGHCETAFMTAIFTSYLPTVKLLLEHGADVNFSRPRVRFTPIQAAAKVGSIEIIQLLLEHGADMNWPALPYRGATALQIASKEGNISVLSYLLEQGAKVDAPASKRFGRTALETAAENGRLDTVAILLKAGAARKGRDSHQIKRAMAFAKSESFDHVARYIREYVWNNTEGSETWEVDDMIDWDGGEI